MNIITVNPADCKRWSYADRSAFEFGDIHKLGLDIKNNGQRGTNNCIPQKGDQTFTIIKYLKAKRKPIQCISLFCRL